MRPDHARLGRVSAAAVVVLVVLFLVGWVRPPLHSYEPVAWEQPRLLGDGRTVRVTVMHGACDLGATVELGRVGPDEVELRAYVMDERIPHGPVWNWAEEGCITLGVHQELDVRLPDPLGTRTLYDPAFDRRELRTPGE